MMNNVAPTKKRGRPIAFDYDTALDQAMHTFWQYGYEGTSMSTLMAVMGMNKASIYAAYGSKDMLFQKAVERYVSGPANFINQSLKQPTASGVVKMLLENAAKMLVEDKCPVGCLVIQGALSCSAEAKHIRALLTNYRVTVETKLKERFERAKLENDLLPSADSAVLAKLIMTIHQGMSVQATGGASYEELLKVAEMATHLITQQSINNTTVDDQSFNAVSTNYGLTSAK